MRRALLPVPRPMASHRASVSLTDPHRISKANQESSNQAGDNPNPEFDLGIPGILKLFIWHKTQLQAEKTRCQPEPREHPHPPSQAPSAPATAPPRSMRRGKKGSNKKGKVRTAPARRPPGATHLILRFRNSIHVPALAYCLC